MPLADGYGVAVGTLARHFIDPPDAEGRWPHYHLVVGTPAGELDCVVNLKSRTEIKVEYRDYRDVDRASLTPVLGFPEGFHQLAPSPSSGALDVIRHPALSDPCTRWWEESGLNLVSLMRFYLERVSRLWVFGEPFGETGGPAGVHNVHMNQGDPPASPFAAENGIWQDGGVLIEYLAPQPRLSLLVTKFQTQSLRTDEAPTP